MVGASRPFWAVMAAVVLAHGVALMELASPSPRMEPRRQGGPGVMQARRIAAGPAASSAPPARVSGPRDTGLAEAAASPLQAPDLTGPSQRPLEETVAAEAPVTGQEDEFLDYLPRNKLTVAPKVLTAVDVEFPPEVGGIVALNVRITLFIDEKGTVRRVRFDGAGIPSAFAAAVLDTFLSARFKPGEVDGVAARSQIRLEVEFRANQGPK